MPGSLLARHLTDTYRLNLLRLRWNASQQALAQWSAITPTSLDDDYAAWSTVSTALVEGAKRQLVTMSDGYLSAYLSAELGRRVPPVGIDPSAYVDTIDGRPLSRALETPLFTVKRALADGRSDALQLGQARATRIVAEEVMDAPRRALGDLMAEHDEVDGWKRVIGSNPCGACLALADGRVHAPTDDFHRHGHCRCIREAVVRGVPDTFSRPTGRAYFDSLTPDAQAALFHGRGGAEKADLIRSGAVPLDALVKREPMAVTPDQFTEASMNDLRALDHRPGDTGPEH